MGSYSFTCAFSGLPIEGGDAVRAFLVTEGPYDKAGVTENDLWFVRTFALRGTYDDYGRVENIAPGPAKDLWLAGLRLDLRKRGTGNNSYHDVPVDRGMPLEELLEAIQKRRLTVTRSYDPYGPIFSKRPPTPKGVPTIKRVESALVKKGIPLAREKARPAALVDLLCYGTVRVRWDEFDAKTSLRQLQKAQKALSRYPTVICSGSSSGGDEPTLLVMTQPLLRGGAIGASVGRDAERGLRVAMAMVREDVWETLCSSGCTVEIGYKDCAVTREDVRAEVRRVWTQTLKTHQKYVRLAKDAPVDMRSPLKVLSDLSLERHPSYVSWALKDAVPFTVGLGSHWGLMIEAYAAGAVSEDQLTDWLNTAADFVILRRKLLETRYYWRPSYSCGPQFGAWQSHVELLDKLHAIAAKNASERAEAED